MGTWTLGDWVQAYAKDGALVHGYVEGLSESGGTARIYVTNSDNSLLIGRRIRVQEPGSKKLEPAGAQTEEELRSLIDLALAAHDREWFDELSAQLQALSAGQRGTAGRSYTAGADRTRRRIRFTEI